MIVISELVIFGLVVAIIFLGFMLGLLVFMFKVQVPEAFLFWKARRKKIPLALVHYPEGIVRPYLVKLDKDINTSSNYYIVGDVGIKFKGVDKSRTERWDGEVTTFNYFVNVPEPISISEVVAFSQFKEYLSSKGIEVENIEDILFYVMSEIEKSKNIDEAVSEIQVENLEILRNIEQFVNFILKNKEEVSNLKLKSGLFTYQTAIKALDVVMAYTSANVSQMKAILQTALRRQLGGDITNYIKYGLMIFLACLGVGAMTILIRNGG